jgi:hypothetical protein
MSKEFKWEMGSEVKDKVTGFKGIVVCRSQYLTGCNRYAVQSQELCDAKPVSWQNFDEDQLEMVGKGMNIDVKDPGGNLEHKMERSSVEER